MTTQIFNSYSSIVPSEMTRHERSHMTLELCKAIHFNRPHAIVRIESNDMLYKVDTDRLKDYQTK